MSLTQLLTVSPSNVSNPDGTNPTLLGGKAGEAIVAELHGKFYTQNYRGHVFCATASVTPGALASTAQTFGLWNYSGSPVNLVPIRFILGAVTTAAGTAGGLGFGYATNWGAGSLATGGVSAITTISAINMNIGGLNSTVAKGVPFSAATVVAAQEPTAFLPLFTFSTQALTAGNQAPMVYDFDGTVIVAPGTTIALGTFTEASLVGNFALVWGEAPI